MQAAINRFRRGDFRRGPGLTLSPVERMYHLLEEIVVCPISRSQRPRYPPTAGSAQSTASERAIMPGNLCPRRFLRLWDLA
jgi:hypothetical protein